MAATTVRAAGTAGPSRTSGPKHAARGLPALVSRAAAWADAHDERRRRRAPGAAGQSTDPGPAAGVWASSKLALATVAAPVVGPVVAARAAANTLQTTRLIASYPAEVEHVLTGGSTTIGRGRVGRLPAASQWFVTSDLHRGTRGAMDWPTLQNTKGLYATALEYYGAHEWGLVENGDVEDFWLVGGSTYGVLYDLVRTLTPLLPRPSRDRLRAHLAGEHLRRIVDNHREIYDRIEELFHRAGRYRRLVGNHDDCYLDERIVDHLRSVHDGLEVYDFLVLDGPTGAAGVLTHGHHTDSWNAPFRSGLGKLSTWLASAVVDAPFLSANPGAPDKAESETLLAGRQHDVLTVVHPLLGFNRDLDSTDEVLLHRAFERHFGTGGPLVVMGHTHIPVTRPSSPHRGEGVWSRYFNSGSGVHWELVTGLEWDGRSDPDRPQVRLVGWHYADQHTPAAAVVAEHEGRPVARRWFEPSDDGRTLRVFPSAS